jgi:hypothetical protein
MSFLKKRAIALLDAGIVTLVGLGLTWIWKHWIQGRPVPYTVLFWLGVFLAALALVSLLQWQLRPKPGPPAPAQGPLTQVRGRIFRNETVLLDGHDYAACEFENCRFQFEGGSYLISQDCRIRGTRTFVCRLAVVNGALLLMRHLQIKLEDVRLIPLKK